MTTYNSVLTDSFGRKHNYLRISLLEKCNLRCTYCMPADGIKLSTKESLMTVDEIEAIAKVFVANGVNKIRLTGGEPLLRKDFAEICNRLSQLNVELSITTNGILLDKYITVLKACGVKSINLSLDTMIASKFETITLRNQFEKVMLNLQLLIRNQFTIKINVVLLKGFNEDEIVTFLKMTQFLPISIRFIEFMPFAGNSWNKEKLVSQEELLGKVYDAFGKEAILAMTNEKNFTARKYKIQNYQGDFGIISSVTNPFCDSCNRIRLTANGRIKNCLFSNIETDILTPFRNGEDLPELIQNCLANKFKIRSGMETSEQLYDPKFHSDNRSMIAIGG